MIDGPKVSVRFLSTEKLGENHAKSNAKRWGFVFHGDRWIGGILFHIPGDSSRDFLIPQLEVTNNL